MINGPKEKYWEYEKTNSNDAAYLSDIQRGRLWTIQKFL